MRENAVSHFYRSSKTKTIQKSQSNNRGGSWRPCNSVCVISAVWDICVILYISLYGWDHQSIGELVIIKTPNINSCVIACPLCLARHRRVELKATDVMRNHIVTSLHQLQQKSWVMATMHWKHQQLHWENQQTQTKLNLFW